MTPLRGNLRPTGDFLVSGMCTRGGPSTPHQKIYRLKIAVDQEEQSVDYMLRGNEQGADYLQLLHPGKLMPNQFFKLHL